MFVRHQTDFISNAQNIDGLILSNNYAFVVCQCNSYFSLSSFLRFYLLFPF